MKINSCDIQEVHLMVSGKVQGVCYRNFVQLHSLKLGIKGWVKNLSDGRVEVLLQGEKKSLEILISLMYEGPSLSRVDEIVPNWKSVSQLYNNFEIKA